MTIGRYVYDGTGRFTIVLGPLGYDEYLSFLPGGSAWRVEPDGAGGALESPVPARLLPGA